MVGVMVGARDDITPVTAGLTRNLVGVAGAVGVAARGPQ